MGINPNQLNMQTPILKYIAKAKKFGAKIKDGKKYVDVIMPPVMSKRYAIGIDTDRKIYFAVQSDEAYIFQEFEISEVSFVRKLVDKKDWLVITTDDASNGRGRQAKGLGEKKIPLRFWFEATDGIFDGFNGIDEDKIISFIGLNFVNNHPEASGEVFLEANLKLRGNWDGVEEIEDVKEEEVVIERFTPNGEDDILAGEDIVFLDDSDIIPLTDDEILEIKTEHLTPD